MCYSCNYDIYVDGVFHKRVYGDDSLNTALFLMRKEYRWTQITYLKVR